MDYRSRYLTTRAKYLGLKNLSSSKKGRIGNQLGGNNDESSKKDNHVAKTGINATELESMFSKATISSPQDPLKMPSKEDVSKNDDLQKMRKQSRAQSRSQTYIMPYIDVYVIQPDYAANASRAIANFLDTSRLYGRDNFFYRIYNHYVTYGVNFINNTILLSAINSTILQQDLINGVFIFQTLDGFVYQVNAINIGVTGYAGTVRAIIWAWAQSFVTTNISHINYLDNLMIQINKNPELQQSSGITSYSGTSISYAPGNMDPQEWYYMMIIGFLTRGQGYFSMASGMGIDSYTYYMITSINRI